MLVWNVLSDGGNEFLGGEDLEVFLVAPVSHRRPVKDLARVLQVGDLLFREGVSQDVFGQRLLTVPIISGYAIPGMHAESTVMPAHELFDELVVYFALGFQHGQDLGTEDLFQFFEVSFRKTVEGPVWAKQPVGDNGVEVWMKPGIIPESVDHHNHTQYSIIEAQHGSKEDIQALLGAVAELRQKLAVVLEIDPQHDRNAEDELSVRDGIEDVVGDVFPELNRLFGMTTRAKPAAFAGKSQEIGMPAFRVGASHPGKSLVQVTASQVFLDHLIHHRPKETILLLTVLIIMGLEVFVVIVQYFP